MSALPRPASDLPTSTTAKLRFDFIDGLRGLAILLVLTGHYYVGTYTTNLPRWFDVFGYGYIGVHLFLLLSGFCVAWPYVGPSNRKFVFKDFFGRRATRILPAYYVVLALSLVLALPMDVQTALIQAITHITMTHNLSTMTVLALNGPFWSLALECQLYLLFPLMLWGSRRYGVVPMLVACLIVQSCFRIFIATKYGTDYTEETFTVTWSVIGRMFEFALGVWLATIVARQQGRPISSRQVLLFSASLVFFLGCSFIAKRYAGRTSPITDLCWSGVFVSIILLASQPNTLVHRIFSSWPIVQLGVISYSVYLTHELLLRYVTPVITQMQRPTITMLLLVPVSLAVILCCYLFYRFVEKPAVDYFAQRRSRVAHPAQAPRVAPSNLNT